jgi:hypothetical protein
MAFWVGDSSRGDQSDWGGEARGHAMCRRAGREGRGCSGQGPIEPLFVRRRIACPLAQLQARRVTPLCTVCPLASGRTPEFSSVFRQFCRSREKHWGNMPSSAFASRSPISKSWLAGSTGLENRWISDSLTRSDFRFLVLSHAVRRFQAGIAGGAANARTGAVDEGLQGTACSESLQQGSSPITGSHQG